MFIATSTTGIAQHQAMEPDKPLDNADVLAMKKAGIGTSVILAAIKYAPLERLDSGSEAFSAAADSSAANSEAGRARKPAV
jgi:hypothetical protein